MSPPEINFYSEDIDFNLDQPEPFVKWLQTAIDQEGKSLFSISFVFCSDTYLHKMNVEYLDHDTLTDVITFPYSDDDTIEGDIYISIDRIKENAQIFNVPFLQELKRVIIHGVLHLSGYGDKSKIEQKKMREKENFYLEKIKKEG